ncbi:MAG: SH3 domain-containing protein, partial [Chloroflexia bacterium]|nr:SH3 domain-containing protein [Chloroflexia bacterium]
MTEAGKNRTMKETGLIQVRRAGLSRRSFVGGAAAFGALALGSPALAQQDQPIIEPIGGTQAGQGQNQVPITLPEEQTVGEIEQMAVLSSGEYFATSGHNLTEPFLAVWRMAGGQAILGIPLSEPRFVEDTGLIEQMFEGITLAQNPTDEGTPTIVGVPLGTATANAFASGPSRRRVNGCAGGEGSCQYFPETGHTVSGLFSLFWSNRGGEAVFGRPLSEPDQNSETTTQVFENVILNLSTADGTITAERIGAEIVAEQGLAFNPAFLPAPPTLGESTLVSASDGLRLRTGPSTDSETEVLLPENAEFIAVRGATGAWIPGYADGYSGWVASEWL